MPEGKRKKRVLKTAALDYEQRYWQRGFRGIVGMDEAGRGPWAGPVTAGAVCLPNTPDLADILTGTRDSKDMTPGLRARLVDDIKGTALAYGVGHASAAEIDQHRINRATQLAMQRALDDLRARFPHFKMDCLFLDTFDWPDAPDGAEVVPIASGDKHSLTVAAASILAKTARDDLMRELDTEYPEYGFAAHKGYGTKRHREALATFGPCPVHRTYYRPIAALIDADES